MAAGSAESISVSAISSAAAFLRIHECLFFIIRSS